MGSSQSCTRNIVNHKISTPFIRSGVRLCVEYKYPVPQAVDYGLIRTRYRYDNSFEETQYFSTHGDAMKYITNLRAGYCDACGNVRNCKHHFTFTQKDV